MHKFLTRNYKAILAGTAILTAVVGVTGLLMKSNSNDKDSISVSTDGSTSVGGHFMVGKTNIIENEYDRVAEKKKDIKVAIRQAHIECQRSKQTLLNLPAERYSVVMLPNFENLVPPGDFIEVAGEQNYNKIKDFFDGSLQPELSTIQMQALVVKMDSTAAKKKKDNPTDRRSEIMQKMLSGINAEQLTKKQQEMLNPESDFDPKATEDIEDPKDRLNARKEILLDKMNTYCEMIVASIQ